MASVKSVKAKAPGLMRVDGNAAEFVDRYIFTATNPVAADTIDYLLPAGAEVARLRFFLDDVDTGATFVFGVGYRPVDTASSLAASPAYFAAAGQTNGQAGGALECAFKPIKFEEDVYIQLLIGTGTTGTNTGKEIWMIASYAQKGPK